MFILVVSIAVGISSVTFQQGSASIAYGCIAKSKPGTGDNRYSTSFLSLHWAIMSLLKSSPKILKTKIDLTKLSQK